MANPISAFFRAGASLVPSPVMATTWFNFFNPVAIKYLSVGDDRANTLSCSATFLKFYIFPTSSSYCPGFIKPPTYYLKSAPVMTVKSPCVYFQLAGNIPAYLAIALAVAGLSPVIILTLTPASKHWATACGIYSLRGSLIPTIPITIRSLAIF